jgi:hypothetical protein
MYTLFCGEALAVGVAIGGYFAFTAKRHGTRHIALHASVDHVLRLNTDCPLQWGTLFFQFDEVSVLADLNNPSKLCIVFIVF